MRLLVALAFVSSLHLFSVAVSCAEAPARPALPDKVSISKVVDEICADGGAWLKCYSLDPSSCEEVTAAFVEPCVKTIFANASKSPGAHPVGQLLGCFNQEFMRKYGYGEVKTPECAHPLKHLMKPQQ